MFAFLQHSLFAIGVNEIFVKMAIVQEDLAISAIVYNRIVEVIGNTHASIVVMARIRRRIDALASATIAAWCSASEKQQERVLEYSMQRS